MRLTITAQGTVIPLQLDILGYQHKKTWIMHFLKACSLLVLYYKLYVYLNDKKKDQWAVRNISPYWPFFLLTIYYLNVLKYYFYNLGNSGVLSSSLCLFFFALPKLTHPIFHMCL